MDPKAIAKFKDKLEPSMQNLREGKANDHDIFPALLCTLLEYAQSNLQAFSTLEQKQQQLEVKVSEIVSKLVQSEESQKVITEEERQLLEKYFSDLMRGVEASYTNIENIQKTTSEIILKRIQEEVLTAQNHLQAGTENFRQQAESAFRQQGESLSSGFAALGENIKISSQLINDRLKWLLILSGAHLLLILILGILVIYK